MTLSVAVALVALAATPTPPPSVAVIVLSGQNTGASPEELRATVVERIEANTRLEISSYRPDVDALLQFRACAGDGRCFAQALLAEQVQVELLLTISVDNLGDSRLLGLRLVDVSKGENMAVAGEEVPAGTSVIRAVRDQLSRAFPKDWWSPHGRVEVVSVPAGARVSSGARSCVSPCQLRLPYGMHTVVVEAPGHEAFRQEVSVMAAVPVQVTAELEASGSLISSPWLWGGVVAAAVIAGSVSAVLLTKGNDPQGVCIARTLDACDGL